MQSISDVDEHLETARQIVEEAGGIALSYFRQPLKVENKLKGNLFDPVTQADREVEAYIRGKLSAFFSADTIIGEEEGTSGGGGDRCWVIDPIDGTRAFISGVPAWGILLGLIDNNRCIGGIMHQPYLGETFVGSDTGAWMIHNNDRIPLQSCQKVRLGQARLYCTHPDMFQQPADLEGFPRVARASCLMRYGGDCYSYCLLALGQIDLVIEGSLQPYDILPLIPIIEGAGGIVTDIRGNPPMEGGLVIAAANEALHAKALALVQGN